jgi:hypothetical protein
MNEHVERFVYRRVEQLRRTHTIARFMLLFGVLWAAPGCIDRRPSALDRVVHPETGYALPDVSEIARIDFLQGDRGLPDFAVPQSCWGDLLAALSPSQRDKIPMPPWTALGVIRITMRAGGEHYVALYLVEGEPVGAFSAGPSDDSRKPYRGGNSEQLKRAIEKAYALHLSAQDTSKAKEGQRKVTVK